MQVPAMDYSQVAELYDVYVKWEFDVPFFLQEARGCGSVLELMSGTGRVSIPLLKAGVPLTCVDSSPDMLKVLERKLKAEGLSATVREMDVCDVALGRTYDLVFIAFHSFAEIQEPADQRRALRAIRNHLAPAGRFICTLHNPRVRLGSITGERVLIGEFPLPDGTGTLSLYGTYRHDPATHLVRGVQRFEIRDAAGGLRSESSVDTSFCLHEKADFQSLVESEGFVVSSLYGDYAYAEFHEDTSPFMIWILKCCTTPGAEQAPEMPHASGEARWARRGRDHFGLSCRRIVLALVRRRP